MNTYRFRNNKHDFTSFYKVDSNFIRTHRILAVCSIHCTYNVLYFQQCIYYDPKGHVILHDQLVTHASLSTG